MKEEIIYEGENDFLIRKYEAKGGELKREIVKTPKTVLVVPKEGDKVYLLKHKRQVVGETLIEFPAGKIEPDEEPLEAAKRELKEETGFRAKNWTKFLEAYLSPGYSTELMHFFIAEDLEEGDTKLQFREEIESFAKNISELEELVKKGEIKDSKTILATLWLESFRET